MRCPVANKCFIAEIIDQVIGSPFFERLLRALREQSIPFDFHASSILADGRTTTVQERMVLLGSPKARGIIIAQNQLTTSCQTSTGNQTHVTRRRNETNSLTRPSHKRRQMLIMHQRNHQTSQRKRANHLMVKEPPNRPRPYRTMKIIQNPSGDWPCRFRISIDPPVMIFSASQVDFGSVPVYASDGSQSSHFANLMPMIYLPL